MTRALPFFALTCALTGAGLASSARASAQSPPPATPATETDAPAPAEPFKVWLDVGHSGLDRERIRTAIARELGAEVILTDTADTPLKVIVSGERLQVAYATPSGESLSRTVDLPSEPERSIEVIALMIGNLTRNEAAELVAELRGKSPEKAPPVAARPEEKPSEAAKAAPPERPPLLKASPPINFSLYNPISLYPDSERRLFNFELGLVGRVGGIDGAALDLGALMVEQHVRGLALGGFVSIVKGPLTGVNLSTLYGGGYELSRGALISGLIVNQRGPLIGANLAGIAALSGPLQGAGIGGALVQTKGTQGVAIAGGVGLHRGRVQGASIAGAFAMSERLDGAGIAGGAQLHSDGKGVLIAGGANVTKRLEGVAIAGGANVGHGQQGLALAGGANVVPELEGFALAGGANVNQNVRGATFAVVNVASKVHGAQIGVLNVAGEVEGAQVGAVNIAKTGRLQLEGFATNLVPFNAGVKFISGWAYSELIVGYHPGDDVIDFSPGIGAHLELPAPLADAAVEIGARGNFRFAEQFPSETPERMDLIYEGRVTYRVLDYLEPFVGGGVRHGLYGPTKGDWDPEVFGGLAVTLPVYGQPR